MGLIFSKHAFSDAQRRAYVADTARKLIEERHGRCLEDRERFSKAGIKWSDIPEIRESALLGWLSRTKRVNKLFDRKAKRQQKRAAARKQTLRARYGIPEPLT